LRGAEQLQKLQRVKFQDDSTTTRFETNSQ
jgi:hypothetical protein